MTLLHFFIDGVRAMFRGNRGCWMWLALLVVLGEALAVAAVVGAMTFVMVDLGRPDRLWHMIPGLGRFNFPTSMLAWDVVVLSGYLVLSVTIPLYVRFPR